jgi:hypothetical protein
MALRRSYVAEDPLYFHGQFTGTDTMYLSDLPYHGTTACAERTYRQAEINAAPEEKPWWKFWD